MQHFGLLLLTATLCVNAGGQSIPKRTAAFSLPDLEVTTTSSSIDGQDQKVLYWAPESAFRETTPLFVFLHSWSSGYRQDNSKWLAQAVKRNWIYIHPDFRGANRSPEACGSRLARQDVVDAVRLARRMFRVDGRRIYLAGVSGGGHMTMLMSGHHPDQFSAASAWVGISDLPEWYRFHTKDEVPTRYAKMMLQCFHGPPGASEAIDAQYRERSPLLHMHKIGSLPIDIFAGVHDGHTGSVPVGQSLRAFSRLAKSHGNPEVSAVEIEELWTNRRLSSPLQSDLQPDPELGRTILLRRQSNGSRITIFDGGHESLPEAACEWLSRHSRLTKN